MATKNYEKRCARLVQDAAEVTYTEALRLVRYHQDRHPEKLTVEERALAVVDGPRAMPPAPPATR